MLLMLLLPLFLAVFAAAAGAARGDPRRLSRGWVTQASDAAHLPNERIRLRNLLMAPRALSLLFKEFAVMERAPSSISAT
jgi:hypothetical protein